MYLILMIVFVLFLLQFVFIFVLNLFQKIAEEAVISVVYVIHGENFKKRFFVVDL